MVMIKDIKVSDNISNKVVKDRNMISLFSGAGGMDLGFEGGFNVLNGSVNKSINPDWIKKEINNRWVNLSPTRFRTVFANDILRPAQLAWMKHFKSLGVDPDVYNLGSIVDIVKEYQNTGVNPFPKGIDVVLGGFPCQDFSISGKRSGLKSHKTHDNIISDAGSPSIESRGQLYMWMKEVISITKPKVFIAENVKGLANLGDVKKIIEDDFRSIGNNGYLVIPSKVLHSAEYGVPQSRERVIFYGFRKDALTDKALLEFSKEDIADIYNPYPIKTHYLPGAIEEDDKLKFVSVEEALSGLKEPEKSKDLSQQSYSKAKFMGKHCQGQIEVNLQGIGPTIRAEHHGNIEFRRLSLENGGKNIKELKSGLEERRLTVRECARLQTFPDDYEFVWPKSKEVEGLYASNSYKIIGNAVPPLLGYHIAKRLEDNWSLYFKDEY